MNQQFIQMQQEKLVNESQAFQQLESFDTLRLMDGPRIDRVKGIDFVKWKQSLLNQIQTKSEKQLKEILKNTKKTMCSHCRRGLKKYEVKCSKDYRAFIVCEYIMRSLS